MTHDASDSFDERISQRAAAKNSLETIPVASEPHGYIPNTPLAASIISFVLGITFSFGALMFVVAENDGNWWTSYQLGFFVSAWSAFHWGEFAVTAGWNREKCSVDSFLLENGALYHVAHSIALLEYFIELHFKPSLKFQPYLSLIGVFVVLFGQVLRSTAMVHASTNFSHVIAFQKRQSHILVTDGIYAWFRHPSYAGFFYWALGTQLVLQNPFSFMLYSILLWRFFNTRIRYEERVLIKFFGEDYMKYRQRVGTKIPFMRT